MPRNTQHHLTPREELYGRIRRFQERLRAAGVDLALIIQNADLFYFSGTCQDAHLMIPAQGEPLMMVRKSYERALKESALDRVTQLKNLAAVRSGIEKYFKGSSRVGLEMDVLPANLFFRYKELLKPMEVVDVSEEIRKTRMIKSPYEIDRLKDSARLSTEMFSQVPSFLRVGMSEVELAGRIEQYMRERGHQGALRVRAFNQEAHMGHLMSGWTAACPSFFNGPTGGAGLNPSFPQSAGYKKIGRNEPIVVDYATVVNGYISDHTRIFSFGQVSDKLTLAHNISLEIKRFFMREAKPGSDGKDLYYSAYQMVQKAGLSEQYMGFGSGVNFVGHGTGLELDELPVIARNHHIILQPGMAFALEPKFVFPNEGAVGIEDTLVVTETGLEQLTGHDDSIQIL
ncbi:M24 family metallopeptidase [Pelotomaculum propionicicum]|uniref:Putative dipeptidase PepE n=1 Tax=Pelotomaculum propionicicum TaxID=258475 RepID=A0A4Y7RL84_9FIRM|nr:Xaa-Pro peptidase family protein [Pelotomaculum propionicicum]NLI14484.1 aminopeptidase P family protein [Peptococcaceae bacterium]TEB09561.1 putative dipeptidase PepE [Pelotomaculum propionicicum]